MAPLGVWIWNSLLSVFPLYLSATAYSMYDEMLEKLLSISAPAVMQSLQTDSWVINGS